MSDVTMSDFFPQADISLEMFYPEGHQFGLQEAARRIFHDVPLEVKRALLPMIVNIQTGNKSELALLRTALALSEILGYGRRAAGE